MSSLLMSIGNGKFLKILLSNAKYRDKMSKTDVPNVRLATAPCLPDYLIATVSGGGFSSAPAFPAFSAMQNSLQTSSPPGFSPLISVLE